MKLSERMPAVFVIGFFALGLAVLGWKFIFGGEGTTRVSVKIPELSALASTGKAAYDANCAQCHGANGSGADEGPPLVHDIYNPGHHADPSFFLAAKQGVRQHHWSFGNMPPQPQVSNRTMTTIVRYVRELQRANGITYRPHRM